MAPDLKSRRDSPHGSRFSRSQTSPHVGLSPGPGWGRSHHQSSRSGVQSSPGPGRSLGVVMSRWSFFSVFTCHVWRSRAPRAHHALHQSQKSSRRSGSVSTMTTWLPASWRRIHCLWYFESSYLGHRIVKPFAKRLPPSRQKGWAGFTEKSMLLWSTKQKNKHISAQSNFRLNSIVYFRTIDL